MRRFLLIHPEWGIFIGSFLGLGFWSKLDPGDQQYAIAFCSKQEALQFAGKTFPEEWKRMSIKPIKTQHNHYASLEEIKAAGLEGWKLSVGDNDEAEQST